jgi:DNA topoisomerase-1
VTKNLIIVESPAKTRTLKKFLGSDYTIEASVGHIRDLVKKNMGIGENYEPIYAVLDNKKDVVKKLKQAAKKADVIYLAPDPDREGEAIAWHIAQVLGVDEERIRRVTFNEITRKAVLAALETPGTLDMQRVDAQQTRRILDRMMGFRISPLLWEKVKRGLSAGRVQSVALKMVCERQAEIDAFVPEEYWILGADLEGENPPPFHARLHKTDSKKASVPDGEAADRIEADFASGTFKVAAVRRKTARKNPSAPFITSRLQQEAARRFSFPVKMTMRVAQGLYEGKEIGGRGQIGLITYMRTDSTRVADTAIESVREVIAQKFGKDHLPDKPNQYRSKKGAQDAHEAIRPTTFDLPPSAVASFLKPEELKLYRLIWNRFVASQMLPALYDVLEVDVERGPHILRASGRSLRRPGYLEIYKEKENGGTSLEAEPEASSFPQLEEGQELRCLKIEKEQKFTQPPARFSEATLVKALEENGIGRPSTYASILSTLTDRDYVSKVERRFQPSELGNLVNRLLQGGFHDIINEGYTASLEAQLDRIEEGEIDWRKALASFDEKLTHDLDAAGRTMPNVKREGVPLDESCPECGEGGLVMRFGRYGTFIGCSRYPECKYTREPEEAKGSSEEETPEEEVAPCEVCGEPMQKRRSKFGVFYGCSAYPKCKNIRRIGPKRAEAKPTGVTCPKCSKGEIEEKKSRRGKIFYSCNTYPKCDFALWNKPVPKACPKCQKPFLVEKTTKRDGTRWLCVDKECGYVETRPEGSEASDPKPSPED